MVEPELQVVRSRCLSCLIFEQADQGVHMHPNHLSKHFIGYVLCPVSKHIGNGGLDTLGVYLFCQHSLRQVQEGLEDQGLQT